MKIQLLRGQFSIIDRGELEKIKLAEKYLTDEFHVKTKIATITESLKRPLRSDIINFILQYFKKETNYLEIGVRHPHHNFDLIKANNKYSVDPGYESDTNPVDFIMTSDEFFSRLRNGEVLDSDIKFDVIFIDGSHLAEQVEKDINNSLDFLSNNGFIVMHDCNPPTEFHATENYYYRLSPSENYWNGTTWKAFFSARKRKDIYSCCIDTDWGVGVISKTMNFGEATAVKNNFFEFHVLYEKRVESLNLISFDMFVSFFKA